MKKMIKRVRRSQQVWAVLKLYARFEDDGYDIFVCGLYRRHKDAERHYQQIQERYRDQSRIWFDMKYVTIIGGEVWIQYASGTKFKTLSGEPVYAQLENEYYSGTVRNKKLPKIR